jgi:hypothetical protein
VNRQTNGHNGFNNLVDLTSPAPLTAYLSTPKGRECKTLEKALHDWHSGEEWEIYRSGGVKCTCQDALRLRMAGFTTVMLVWQAEDLRVHGHALELK